MIVKIFDYFHSHIRILSAALFVTTALLIALVFRLSYKEDISDFLPLGASEREAMSVYQDISGVNRLFVLFRNPHDADRTVEAINLFTSTVEKNDTAHLCHDLTATFDMDKLSAVIDFVYSNIPYFLTEADYRRMDSMLATPGFIDSQLDADQQMLMFPSGSMLSQNISRDPLNLFTPVAQRLQNFQQESHFETYDGYIFTPDTTRAIVMLTSPFGNSETEMNTRLLTLLDESIAEMNTEFPDVEAHVVGGPQVAVGNASQIKHDSILAVALASVLILALLIYSFRSVRNMMLIAVSIVWGWLFAMGGMAIMHDSISLIVIGISSVIIGIAVNYPLHLIAHTDHETDKRSALREIVTPLLVGNITTVGAFLALLPLHSVAMRDLGLFAAFLLIGTIIFVLIFLPHFLKSNTTPLQEHLVLARIADVHPEQHRWLVWVVAVLTVVFGYFSLSTEFDSNMANINYMTDEQRADMQYFERLLSSDSTSSAQTLYVMSSAQTYDAALDKAASRQSAIKALESHGLILHHNGVNDFLASAKEQQCRLDRWKEWGSRHPDLLASLNSAATAHGFSPDAFSDFQSIITASYQPHSFDYFQPLTSLAFAGNISLDKQTARHTIVDVLRVETANVPAVKDALPDCFDIASLNSRLADSLSDDFNYIGWACSLIVFFFLWFSFRRIELAIISFLPMAVSWVWILGIMSILDIKFNIVNIILATFIFGQGDDYTIFITEGCISEYIHKKPVLASYKNSIILSALIMFIGIGTLIIAQHPALRSLAEVTIVGMFSVVFMAYLIPPLMFKWLMRIFPKRFENL